MLVVLGLGAIDALLWSRLRSTSVPSADRPARAPAPDVDGVPRVRPVLSPAGPTAPGPTTTRPPAPIVTSPTMPSEPPALVDAPERPDLGHEFDLVITGGRIIDPGSGFDGLVDVGVDGGVITEVAARSLKGRDAVDATGLVVAPGFIDLLSYEPNQFGVWFKLADGVTTNLAMHGVNNYSSAFFRRYDGASPIHFGGAFHHHFMRGIEAGVDIFNAPTGAELDGLRALVDLHLRQGFAGVSFSPEYSPGTTTGEMIELSRIAVDLGHVAFFHLRHSDPTPPGTSLEAVEEALSVARATGVSVHIEHLTSTGGTHVMPAALNLINRARDEEGLDVSACVYPYDFWGTFLASNRFADGWQERYGLTEGDLQIAGTPTRLTAETFAAARAQNRLVAALGSIPETDVEAALAEPWMIVASDAIPNPGANNHPRGAGTFARTIGRYVRERGLLDLSEALAKMTILPARRVERMLPAVARKGRLRRGADADLVVFDPVAIADRSTVEFPAEPSVGIVHVLVDGRRALRDGRPDRSVLAGRSLRSGIG